MMHVTELHINLDIDVYLRAWVQLRHHGSLEGLLQVEAHLSGLAVPVRSPLPLRGAKRCHAVLAVDDSPIVTSPTAGASDLQKETLLGCCKKASAGILKWKVMENKQLLRPIKLSLAEAIMHQQCFLLLFLFNKKDVNI